MIDFTIGEARRVLVSVHIDVYCGRVVALPSRVSSVDGIDIELEHKKFPIRLATHHRHQDTIDRQLTVYL